MILKNSFYDISQNKKSTSLLADGSSALSEPDRIRTYDRLLRREVLYPAELRAQSRTAVLKLAVSTIKKFNSSYGRQIYNIY